MSEKIGLLEGHLGSDSLDVSVETIKNWESHEEVSDSYEEYKKAAARVKAMQQQLVRASLPEVTRKSNSPRNPAIDEDEDEEPEVVVVKARSLRESTRLQSKRILPLGDSDDEMSSPLKVVETGVVTNEGIDTSPTAHHRGQRRNPEA